MSHAHRLTAAVAAATLTVIVAALIALPSVTTAIAGISLNAID
jgi:hypothetical protein